MYYSIFNKDDKFILSKYLNKKLKVGDSILLKSDTPSKVENVINKGTTIEYIVN